MQGCVRDGRARHVIGAIDDRAARKDEAVERSRETQRSSFVPTSERGMDEAPLPPPPPNILRSRPRLTPGDAGAGRYAILERRFTER